MSVNLIKSCSLRKVKGFWKSGHSRGLARKASASRPWLIILRAVVFSVALKLDVDSFRISISILGFYNLILYPKYFPKFQHYHFKQSHIILLKKYALFWLIDSCFLLLFFYCYKWCCHEHLVVDKVFFPFRINWYIIEGNKLFNCSGYLLPKYFWKGRRA